MAQQENKKDNSRTNISNSDYGELTASSEAAVTERLLESLNQMRQRLGVSGTYLRLPDIHPDTRAALEGLKIVMVDDNAGMLEIWYSLLGPATDSRADVVHHTSQKRDDLIAEIIATNPDVILLDYSLRDDITGGQLIAPLKELLPRAVIIAFSADHYNNARMVKCGAHSSADKSASESFREAVLQQIGKFVKTYVTPHQDDVANG